MNQQIVRLRFVAIVLVLIIHSSATFLYKPVGEVFYIGNLFDSLSRAAVPLFLMISGALLLDKEETISAFLKKRASKIVIPFLTWSVIYYLYKVNFSHFDFFEFLKLLIRGDIYFHLWYLYLIIPVYLFIPLLRKMVKDTPTDYILFYIILSLLLENFLDVFVAYFGFEPKVYFAGFSGYISYLLIGYLIIKRNFLLNHKKWVFVAGILSLFVTFFGTALGTMHKGSYDGYFYGYLSLNVFIYSVFLMVLILQIKGPVNPLVKSISTHSFMIYFAHILFLIYFQEILNSYDLQPFVYIPVLFVLTLICSFLFSIVVSRIPVLRKVL
jgi:surface polysaccharide O-acyltransferase-like enzyme